MLPWLHESSKQLPAVVQAEVTAVTLSRDNTVDSQTRHKVHVANVCMKFLQCHIFPDKSELIVMLDESPDGTQQGQQLAASWSQPPIALVIRLTLYCCSH